MRERTLRRKEALKSLIQLSIGIAILLWLIQLAEAAEILGDILTANSVYLTIASLAFITASTMIGLALYVFLKKMGINPSIKNTILASFSGQLLSDITPARSGYFLTGLILNRIDGTPVESAMAGVVATGAVNFLVKAGFSIMSLAYFVKILPLDSAVINALLFGIALLVAGGIGLLAVMWGNRLTSLLTKLRRVPFLKGVIRDIMDILNKLQEEARRSSRPLMLVALLVFLSIIANAAALLFIFKSIQQSPPTFLVFVLIVPLISAFNFIPITIAGLGIQEASYVFFWTLLGISLDKAVSFTLINRLLFTATDIIGLPTLLKVGFIRSLLSHDE